MNKADKVYNKLVKKVIKEGEWENNRTAIASKFIWCAEIKFDLRDGFPIITSRSIPFKSVRVELEGFMNAITDKSWYQERGCKYWDEWCSPEKVKYSKDDPIKLEEAKKENYLGPIYGVQWRAFGDPTVDGKKVDQLKNAIDDINARRNTRRIIVNAWNPTAIDKMALPPCHYEYHFSISQNKYLDICWSQRSVDVGLGLPSNIASYATLLSVVAKETGLIPRYLVGHLKNVHLYENQIEPIKEIIKLKTHPAPTLEFNDKFTTALEWKHDQCKLINYTNNGRYDLGPPAV